jgi:hypothetical protein
MHLFGEAADVQIETPPLGQLEDLPIFHATPKSNIFFLCYWVPEGAAAFEDP